MVSASELTSCWPPLLLHQVRHVGVRSPTFIFFFYLEILAGEFGNYLEFFGMLGPESVPLVGLLHSGWHRNGVQLEIHVTFPTQRAAVEQVLQKLEELKAYGAHKTESPRTYSVGTNYSKW